MLIVGHRGAPREAFENSYLAFEKAVEAKADRIELDVVMSKDQGLFIAHDDDLSRITGRKCFISRSTDEDLQSLKLNDGQEIPMLQMVLERFLSRIEINIEIKGSSHESAAQIVSLIKKNPLRDRIIISCFHPEPLKYFAKNLSDVRRACLIGDKPRWPNFAEQNPLLFMNEICTDIIHPWVPLVDENFMDQANARRWTVIPYCSMHGEEDDDMLGVWTSLKTLGVEGLCTNYPRELRSWLDEINRHE